MLKRVSLFLTILFLLTTLVEAFHYHDDGADHPECSICAATHQQANTCSPSSIPEISLQYLDTPYPRPVLPFVTTADFTPFNIRAPPA